MANIPLGCCGGTQRRFPAGHVIPTAVAASTAATRREQREVHQRSVIRSHDWSCDGLLGVAANRPRRQVRQQINLKFSIECRNQDMVVAAADGKRTRRPFVMRPEQKIMRRGPFLQDVSVKGQVQFGQNGRSGRNGAWTEECGWMIYAVNFDSGDKMEHGFNISRLEAYTERVPSEVLCVNAIIEDEEDQVIIFKGFSSSLTRATPNDQSEPVLPSTSVVVGIDRMRGPYRPSAPEYIQQGVSWHDFQALLQEQGL